jgi:hypothetical protein
MDFPPWIESALASLAAPPQLRARLTRRWKELEQDVLPAFARLPDDRARQRLFEQLLWAIRYHDPAATRAQRRDRARATELDREIRQAAGALAELCHQREALAPPSARPPPWEVLARAAAHFPDWATTARLDSFLIIATTQSRPGPAWSHVFAALAEAGPEEPPADPILASRKATADPVRALLVAVDRLRRAGLLPSSFKIPDQAMATWLNVTLEPPETLDAEGVKKVRRRWRGDDSRLKIV